MTTVVLIVAPTVRAATVMVKLLTSPLSMNWVGVYWKKAVRAMVLTEAGLVATQVKLTRLLVKARLEIVRRVWVLFEEEVDVVGGFGDIVS